MLVVYGSETGNAQDVAELLAAYTKQAVAPSSCALPMDCVTLEELAKEDLVLFVCSTTGTIGCVLKHSVPNVRSCPHEGVLRDICDSFHAHNTAHGRMHRPRTPYFRIEQGLNF